MNALPSAPSRPRPPVPKRIRPVLDATDRAILRHLHADARVTNAALADAVIDPAAVGLRLQAMIAVRVQGTARAEMATLAHELAARPEVLDVYFLAGVDDFLVHVAARDTETLRAFVVDQLSARPEIAHTETNLIFEHLPARRPVADAG